MITRCALTIAGSDSSGGAGIQADLKAFAALGVHGACVVTAITAQSTAGIDDITGVSPGMVRDQIRAVLRDLRVDAVKVGMLYSDGTVEVVAQEIKGHRFPVIVDPVLVAGCGVPLLMPEALAPFKELMVPLATVITPNVYEAEALTGIAVREPSDAVKAAEALTGLGAGSVVVKGGHLPTDEVVDVLYVDGEAFFLRHERVRARAVHGAGCCFSSAIAAEMAKGESVREAVESAERFVVEAIRFGLPVGRGYGPVSPTATVLRDAERYRVLRDVREAVEALEAHPEVASLVPEVQMNVAMAISQAETVEDVAAVPGRIARVGDRVRASSCPAFGGSRHVASAVLTAMRFDPTVRAAMDIRYSEPIMQACRRLGFSMSRYDRGREPKRVREVEGASTPWAVRRAIEGAGRGVPDIIHLTEAVGKEAVILVFGKSALDVAEKALRIAGEL